MMNIYKEGSATRVNATNGALNIIWNNVFNVEILVYGRYRKKVVGLCGTYNDDRSDDFLTSSNMTAENPTAFGNSWKTDPACADAPTVEHPCVTNPNRTENARKDCSALLQAPFWACNKTVNATEQYYIADCEYDMCACENNPAACLCQIFDSYASACSVDGVNISWIGDFPQCSKCSSFGCLILKYPSQP